MPRRRLHEIELQGMWQRFSERARKAMYFAQEEAQRFGCDRISSEHILLGLAREENVAGQILNRLYVSLNRLRREIENQLPPAEQEPIQEMTLTPRVKRVIDLAYDEARRLNNNYIGTEHLLLGVIRDGDWIAAHTLSKMGVELEAARREVVRFHDENGDVHREEATDPVYRILPPHGATKPGAYVLIGFLMGRFFLHHLLLAMTADERGIAAQVIRTQCQDVSKLQSQIWGSLVKASKTGLNTPEPGVLDWLLQAASKEAKGGPVLSEDLLLGMLTSPELPIVMLMNAHGVTLERSRELVAEIRSADDC